VIYRRPCLQNAHAGVCSGGGTEIHAIHGIHYFCNPSNIDGRVYVYVCIWLGLGLVLGLVLGFGLGLGFAMMCSGHGHLC